MIDFKEKANLIWSVADLLRGDYNQADDGKVILPMTVLRCLDSVLEPHTKNKCKMMRRRTPQSDRRILSPREVNRQLYDYLFGHTGRDIGNGASS
jgi:hypothetical protein